jgi:hypothetical protein
MSRTKLTSDKTIEIKPLLEVELSNVVLPVLVFQKMCFQRVKEVEGKTTAVQCTWPRSQESISIS